MTQRDRFELRFAQEMGTRQNMVDTKLKQQKNDSRRMREFWHRRQVFDREWLRHEGEPEIIRLAWGLAAYLLEREIWFEDELLAGNYGFTEYRHSLAFSFMENYEALLSDAEKGLPVDIQLLERSIPMQNACVAGIGGGLHVVGGFQRALALGMDGISAALDAGIEKNGETDFLRAGKIVVSAARMYFQRYADQAMMEAALTEDEASKARLTSMAKACAYIVHEPPVTFREALQLVTLLHEVIQIEERCGSLSFGRFDYYMFPYYQRDVEAGILTQEEAQALIDVFWKKLAQNRWGWQNITLGGYDDLNGGCDNAITRMCLSATRRLKTDQPQVSFRCYPGMSDDLWESIFSVIRTGVGFPSLFNDDVCIRSKMRVGVSPEDAQQYGVLGCVEVTIPEKEYSHTEGIRFNLPKLLELCLTGGRCMMSGTVVPLESPCDLDQFESFDQFYRWFKGEFIRMMLIMVDATDELQAHYGRHFPIPFLSSTMYGCAESGRDATEAGTVYNHTCINVCGQATLIDSLCAIRRFVFEEKRYSFSAYVQMLERDFKDCEDERLAIWNNSPRFGCDEGNAALMRDLIDFMCGEILLRDNKRGGKHEFGFYSVETQVGFGLKTGATADGRHAGQPLSNGMAPVQGMEKEGPTAVLEAVSKIDGTYLSNGMALDLKFHPRFLESRVHRDKFRDALKAYFAMGGMQAQINVVDRETLLAAQKDPEQYRDLIVRVSGFSAYFCDLSREVQDEIISRTQHERI